MPHFILEPGHWCWHNDHGEGEVLARLPNDKLIVRFQRWDFPDGVVIESNIKTVAAMSPRITPYDGGERNLPTAHWLLTDGTKANIVLVPRGEWIVCNFGGHGIVLESCSENFQLVYLDCSGCRHERGVWEKIVLDNPATLPVCWVALPDSPSEAQTPPPDTTVFAKFRKSAHEWQGIVSDCEEGFLEQPDYVEHLLYCRELIDNEVRLNPALTLLAEWQAVVTADAQFRTTAGDTMPDLAERYPYWWQQVGWSIYARVNRQYDESPEGIAQHEKKARVKAAHARSLKTEDTVASNENAEIHEPRKVVGRGASGE
jgi:hypothetical protein